MMARFIFIRTADNLWVQEGGPLVSRASSPLCRAPTPTPSGFWLLLHRTCTVRMSCSGNCFPFSYTCTTALDAFETWNYLESVYERERIPDWNFCNVALKHLLLITWFSSSSSSPSTKNNVSNKSRRTSHKLLLRIMLLNRSQSFPLSEGSSTSGKQQSPVQRGLHLDAALFRAVSSSASNLHFPCGSNRNISIISRSFITRSPHRHSKYSNIMCISKRMCA